MGKVLRYVLVTSLSRKRFGLVTNIAGHETAPPMVAD